MPIRPVLAVAAAAAAAIGLGAPCMAQDVIGLSPAERERVLNEAADNAPINGAPGLGDGKIHGEMGIEVGSHGGRAVYGSTVVPLGTTGAIGLSFLKAQGGAPRGW